MIIGGTASVYVSNMENSIDFYTKKLGLTLQSKVGNTWAKIDAGNGLTIGLHPASPPATVNAGTQGSINIELAVTGKLKDVVNVLKQRGVCFNGEIQEYDAVHIASLFDPDQNTILLA